MTPLNNAFGWEEHTEPPAPPFVWNMWCTCTTCGRLLERQGTTLPAVPGEQIHHHCLPRGTRPVHLDAEYDEAFEAFKNSLRRS